MTRQKEYPQVSSRKEVEARKKKLVPLPPTIITPQDSCEPHLKNIEFDLGPILMQH